MAVFGAMLMPSTLSLIRNIFPDPNRRRLAIAIWAAGFSGGAALGPIFGGWLVEQFWWGAVLLVAAAHLLPLLAFGRVFIPESRDPNPGRVDVTSIVLSLLTMVPVVYGIKELAVQGFGASAPAVHGLRPGDGHSVSFAASSGSRARMLDVALFKNRVFSTAIMANVLSLFSFNGFISSWPSTCSLLRDSRPMESGIAMIPALLATVIAGLLVVPLVKGPARVRGRRQG